jgi:hypothetical protein
VAFMTRGWGNSVTVPSDRSVRIRSS